MSAKHTQGPWQVISMGGIAVAVEIGDKVVDGSYNGGDSDEIPDADFRLMAAAPDLLEALEACMTMLYPSSDEYQQARAAIAKATGA